jgi:hypothetical protein
MNKYGSRRSFDLEWVERWARCVNDDRILPVIGRFFNNRFVLGVDETEFLIEVRGGKIARISEGLTPNDLGFDFALRAPSSAWAKFVIDGNQLPFWQNMRALTRMLSLMRQV